jgi:hypothetical protein
MRRPAVLRCVLAGGGPRPFLAAIIIQEIGRGGSYGGQCS